MVSRTVRHHKIENHPDREIIVQKLSNGESVRHIRSWLKKKHPTSKYLHLSIPTLQEYRKEVMGLEGKVLQDIQNVKRAQDQQIETKIIQQSVQNTNAYQEKLTQIADKHLDVSTRLLQMDAVIGDRIEYWYNLVKSGEELPDKCDRELRKYIDQQILLLQQYKKLVEGMADKTVDYNVNITVMNEQIGTIQSVIRECIFEEFGIEKAMDFMERLSKRLSGGSTKQISAPKDVEVAILDD